KNLDRTGVLVPHVRLLGLVKRAQPDAHRHVQPQTFFVNRIEPPVIGFADGSVDRLGRLDRHTFAALEFHAAANLLYPPIGAATEIEPGPSDEPVRVLIDAFEYLVVRN